MVLIDSNVLIDVITQDPVWSEWSLTQLRAAKARDKLTINAVIYAEIVVAYESAAELDSFLKPTGIASSISPTRRLSSRAVPSCATAQQKATKTGVLLDFFIGAQAQAEGWTLLSRDATRYKRYFPAVQLICP